MQKNYHDRHRMVNVRVTPAEYARIKAAADRDGQSVSGYITGFLRERLGFIGLKARAGDEG